MRRSGILLPVSCLPSEYGIGGFSDEAYRFIDFLKLAGQSLWQILPLGPTGYGDSPYQSFSTFAGNPYYIDLVDLKRSGLLSVDELREAKDDGTRIDYERLYRTRFVLLRKAYARAKDKGLHKMKEYQSFVKKNSFWLDDYALFMAVKDSYGGKSWVEWEEGIRLRTPEALARYRKELAEETAFYCFLQYLFMRQWQKIREYAKDAGIRIIGDLPIYVAFDSADTWAHPELFALDEAHLPVAVAGCPPDAFSETGQLWGNPLYRWDYHKETGYAWWMKRIRHAYELYDILRIDHFRGFDEYWAVPYGDDTAQNGRWEKGPGISFFRTLQKKLGNVEVIAEDLGYLTESVRQLLREAGYPGMKVLQFAFVAGTESDYLPHNHIRNCVVYTGTHDNDTTTGWLKTMKEEDARFLKNYLGVKDGHHLERVLIRTALASVADTAVIPLQDYLGLGSEARINTPSTLGGNWCWRLESKALSRKLGQNIRNLTALYGRLGTVSVPR